MLQYFGLYSVPFREIFHFEHCSSPLRVDVINGWPLIKNLSPRDHVTPTLRELHWLPIPARINFKICLLMYRVYTNSFPSYVSSLVTSCSSLQSRRALRSSSQADFVVTRSIRKF